MTVPTFVSAGTVSSSTGNATPGLPGGWAQYDIFLLVVETANQTVSAPTDWTEVDVSPQGTGTAGGSSSTAMHVFWRRATASESAPTVSDPGDHCVAQIFAIRGCVRAGNPWNASGGNVEASAIDPGTITGITSTVDDSMIVFCAGFNFHVPSFSSLTFTNVNVSSITNITAGTYNVGNGGGLGVATGTKASSGAIGSTTVSWTGASGGIPGFHGFVVLALTPAAELACAAGSYTIAGTDCVLNRGRILTCDAGSYAIAGTDCDLNVARIITFDAGSYAITGTDASLESGGNFEIGCESGEYAISGKSSDLIISRYLEAEPDLNAYGMVGKSSQLLPTRRAGNRAPFCTCCIGGCCNNRVVFPECITLELNVNCCSDSPSTITLCQNGGPPFPEFPDIRWTGETDNPWCLMDGTNHLNGTNIGIGCLTDLETGEEGWYIIIKDTDGGHVWSPSQVWQLTLISCNPLLWEFGGPANCAEDPCVIEWQVACFDGYTLISTLSGTRQIQNISIGDQIIGKDGEVETVQDIRSSVSPLVWVIVDDTGTNTIVTPEHPFLRGDEWVPVEQISEGDILSGKRVVQKVLVRRNWVVWNMTVSGSHTFTANGFIVHNK